MFEILHLSSQYTNKLNNKVKEDKKIMINNNLNKVNKIKKKHIIMLIHYHLIHYISWYKHVELLYLMVRTNYQLLVFNFKSKMVNISVLPFLSL